MSKIMLVILMVVAMGAPVHAAEAIRFDPNYIEIHSSWSGLSAHRPAPVDIICRRDAQWSCTHGYVLPAGAIHRLLWVLSLPQASTFSLAAAGFTSDVLHAIVSKTGGTLSDACTGRYVTAWFNRQVVMTDTAPSVYVDLRDDRAGAVRVESTSWRPFMLPWSISRDGVETTSYNYQVMQAVATFLPASHPNVDALSTAYAVETLADSLARGVQYPPSLPASFRNVCQHGLSSAL